MNRELQFQLELATDLLNWHTRQVAIQTDRIEKITKEIEKDQIAKATDFVKNGVKKASGITMV